MPIDAKDGGLPFMMPLAFLAKGHKLLLCRLVRGVGIARNAAVDRKLGAIGGVGEKAAPGMPEAELDLLPVKELRLALQGMQLIEMVDHGNRLEAALQLLKLKELLFKRFRPVLTSGKLGLP